MLDSLCSDMLISLCSDNLDGHACRDRLWCQRHHIADASSKPKTNIPMSNALIAGHRCAKVGFDCTNAASYGPFILPNPPRGNIYIPRTKLQRSKSQSGKELQ
ncbi:hypothetical protein PMIN04_000168 [Paraphaeosphaeria minitans]